MRRAWPFLLVLLLATSAWAHPVALGVSASPDQVEITGEIATTLVAEWPAGWSVAPPRPKREEGMFDVACQPAQVTQREDGGGRWTMDCTLRAFEPGTVELPNFPVAVVGPDGSRETATFPAYAVEVVGPMVGEQPKPLKAQETIHRDWKKIGFYIGAVLVGLALGFGLVYLLARKLRGRKRKEKIKPSDPPDRVALSRLDGPELKRLFKEGKSKPYYSELTDIVRQYLEGRFDLPAPDRTTREVMDELRKRDLDQHRDFIVELLTTADYAKFAGVEIARSRWDEDREHSRRFIEQTRAPEKPQTESDDATPEEES